MQMEGKNGRDLHENKISVQFQFCYNMMYFMDFPIRYLLSDQETCKCLLSEPQQETH